MNIKTYFEKRYKVVRSSLRTYNIISLALILFALSAFVIAFLTEISFGSDIMKFGLSSISFLTGGGIQGVVYSQKKELIVIEFCISKADQYNQLSDFEKKILDQAFNR